MAADDDGGLPDAGALYDEAPCGLLLTDAAGTILEANRTFSRWLDIPPDALCGRRFQDLLTMGGRIFHQTHWMPLLQMQGSIAEIKLDLLKSDGQPIPMVMNAVRHERADRVWHELAVFVAQDRHAYEKELMRARKQAEQFLVAQQAAQRAAEDRALLAEQMIGIVSHDLRNPLAAILMGASALDAEKLGTKSRRYLGYISESTERAQHLVDDLLDFTLARLGRGISVDRKPFDLHEVVAQCVAELARAHPEHALQHRAEGAGECVADAQRLFQLLGNLVGNAVAYGDPASPITVTSRAGGGGCAVSVHNEGPPIPPKVIPTLFDAMVRGGAESSSAHHVGLGLYIVNEIARAHDGSMSVTSSAEEGTTFTFEF